MGKRENNLNPEAFGASMKNLINSTTNNTIAFSCKICSKTYVSEEELKVHRISHKETKNYCCKYCGMTLKLQNSTKFTYSRTKMSCQKVNLHEVNKYNIDYLDVFESYQIWRTI